MIELLMVIMLVAILGATALPQFLDFRQEARLAATQQNLQAMRVGIKLQIQQAILKCNAAPGFVPSYEAIYSNSIAYSSGPCAGIISGNDARFVDFSQADFGVSSRGDLPIENLLKDTSTSAIRGVVACSEDTFACNSIAMNATRTWGDSPGPETGGWCYDETTGHFWAQTTIENACAL